MALQQKEKNPGQDEYDQNFDFERHERELQHANPSSPDNPAERAGMDRAQAWRRDSRPVAEREAAPSWDTNLGNRPEVKPRGGGGKSPGDRAKNMLKKRATQWIIGGIITSVIGLAVAIPAALSSAFVNLKELGSDWAHKNNHSYFSKRTSKYMHKKFFQADKNCNSGVKCRFKTGVSDQEVNKMKAAGLNPELGQDGDKKFVKSFNTTDADGKALRVNADNFEEHYGSNGSGNVRFRAALDTIAKPKALLLRGKQTLKLVFNKFGIKKNRDISGADDRERAKNLRQDMYSEGNPNERVNTAPADQTNSGDEARIAGVDQSINDAAQAERDALTSSEFDRPPSIVPDTTNLDLSPDRAPEVASGIVKGGLKGAVLGVFSAIDKACSGYQLIRAVTFGAKIYKVISLIKYAGIFMTLADKLKAGDAKSSEIGFLGALLMRPSAKKDSYGKTFFQSEGFNLVTQGKIADHRGLARFTAGSSFLKFFQATQKKFEQAGANKQTCKQVKSWYGQVTLAVAGVALAGFSGGTSIIAGVVVSGVMSLIFSTIEAYVTPLLIQYAAGTVAPDPTDPEGGYGAGNAFGTALGALGHFTGSANGERILTKADAAAVEMESNKEMAFQNKVDNYGKSPFALDNYTSVTSHLAMAIAPIAASPFSQNAFQSVASIITSPLSLFSSSLSGIVTGGVNAQSDISRGGEFCADDDSIQMGLAVDANCNPIPGEKDSVIQDPRYAPDAVDKWMFDNGHADPETGEAKSDDFKKYIASCVDSTVPISPDGGGSDVGEDVDTRWCIDTREEFNYFRFYVANDAVDAAHEASVKGTLGQEDSSQPDTPLTGNTYPNGKLPDNALCALGSQWPGQKLRCDAADAFAKMAAAYQQQFGTPMVIIDSYRTYDEQAKLYPTKPPGMAAKPGFSNHGCGQAVDLGGGITSAGSTQYNWMLSKAAPFGWVHPVWATSPATLEPWHWEFGTGGNGNNGTCQV
jgi:hypothetical protein